MAEKRNRTQRRFTALFVKTARAGFYSDAACPTLNLKVRPSGSRSWVQRIMIDGKQAMLGLGPYPVVALEEARDAAIDNRRAVRAGIDPRAAKRSRRAVPTFAEAVEKVIEIRRAKWRDGNGEASEDQWRASLATYAFPIIGKRTVAAIETADVMRVLTPIWQSKHTTAKRVRQRISAVMKWAIAEGHRQDDPAGEALLAALPAPARKVERHDALPHSECGAAVRAIRGSNGLYWGAAKCLEFIILTAARSGEARGARWDEIDLGEKVWTVPAERMKAGVEHRVPLSSSAVRLLRDARALSDGSGCVFPSVRSGRELARQTLPRAMVAEGIAATVHGFRSSFRDWCEERTDTPRSVSEAALAHTVEGVEGRYLRTDLFERRRVLMEQWAAYLEN